MIQVPYKIVGYRFYIHLHIFHWCFYYLLEQAVVPITFGINAVVIAFFFVMSLFPSFFQFQRIYQGAALNRSGVLSPIGGIHFHGKLKTAEVAIFPAARSEER